MYRHLAHNYWLVQHVGILLLNSEIWYFDVTMAWLGSCSMYFDEF